MTSPFLHKDSRSFGEAWGTDVARPNTLRQHFEASHSLDCKQMFTNSLRCFRLDGLDFHATLTSRHCTSNSTDQCIRQHAIFLNYYFLNLALPLRSFGVEHEYKISLSACWRYSINCGIPPFQDTQIDRAEWPDVHYR